MAETRIRSKTAEKGKGEMKKLPFIGANLEVTTYTHLSREIIMEIKKFYLEHGCIEPFLIEVRFSNELKFDISINPHFTKIIFNLNQVV